jgi:integrase
MPARPSAGTVPSQGRGVEALNERIAAARALLRAGRPRRVYLGGRKPAPVPNPCDPAQSVLAFACNVYAPLRGLRPASALDIIHALKRAARMLGRELTFADLTGDFLDRYLLWRKSEGITNPFTLNKETRALAAVWRFAWRKEKAGELPRDVPRQREPKREPLAWSLSQLVLMIRAAAVLDGELPQSRHYRHLPAARLADAMAALILTIYYTGLRSGAILALSPTAFDPATGWLTVPAELQKHAADQVFKLPDDAALALRRIYEPRGPRLFLVTNKTAIFRYIRPAFSRILKLAGIEREDQWTFHRIRKSTATYLCDETDEETTRKQLGHSSLQMTRRYIDKRMLRRKETADILPRLDDGAA